MPCYLTGSAEGDARLSASESRAEVTKLAALLCKVCETYENTPEGSDVYLPSDVLSWWNEHKKIDAERLRREAEDLQRNQARKNALSKLTAAERRALNLD
jgi:hypothetical protein